MDKQQDNLLPGIPWIPVTRLMPLPYDLDLDKDVDHVNVAELPYCLIINESRVPVLAIWTLQMGWMLPSHGRFTDPEHVTHWCPIDRPDFLNSWIEEFLQEFITIRHQ